MELLLDPRMDWIRLSPLSERDRPALATLVERLRGGDSVAISRVLRELLPNVRRWTQRFVGPNADLEDAVQETMTEIASALHRFEGRCAITTLAHRIAVRHAARFVRRSPKRFVHQETETVADEESCPERSLSEREALSRLYAHLQALSEHRRTAFVLCGIEEMSPAEAAEVAGCSATAMRSRLFEARNELASRIARDAMRNIGRGTRR